MVAISQRSIPKDQLYEDKKIKVRCFVITVQVLNTAKILRLSLFKWQVPPTPIFKQL